jgi:hypothetical protein
VIEWYEATTRQTRRNCGGSNVAPALVKEESLEEDLRSSRPDRDRTRDRDRARIKRIAPYLGDETFMLTYGDGVSNVDLSALVEFHRWHGKLATMAVVHPPARFGKVELKGEDRARTARRWDPRAANQMGGQRKASAVRMRGLPLTRRPVPTKKGTQPTSAATGVTFCAISDEPYFLCAVAWLNTLR